MISPPNSSLKRGELLSHCGIIMTFLWIRLKTDKAEALGLCDDTGALDVLLHIPVDKGGFPRGMVP
jgi:hypothetical protein